MKKRASIVVAILLLAVGFAAISTTLVINGSTSVGENTEDFDVIFTAATLDGEDVYNTVIDDTKKIINFTTSDLKTLNQTSVLTYEVTNNSANYDAEIEVNCKVKDSTTAKYTSIENVLEGNATVIKAKETLNGTLTVTLNKTATEEVREEYTCTITSNAKERDTLAVSEPTLYDLIKNNADKTTVIDYEVRSGASGTNGIYTTTATEGNVPVYYYRGDADKVNNDIIFNNMCWKIIRTTETGGVKLIYNGVPTDGKCETQTGETTQIGKKLFATSLDDNAYVGYMYGTPGSTTYAATHENKNDSTIKTYIDNWYENNFDETATSKLEDTVFCNDRSTKAYDASTIADTSTSSYGDLGYGKNETLYGVAHRASWASINPNPSLVCQNTNDKFTVNAKNGNGALTYPIGLITADEAIFAGFNTNASNESDYKDTTNYLYTNNSYWTISPVGYNPSYNHGSYVALIGDVGTVITAFVYSEYDNYDSRGVRPVVSLAKGTYVTGEGTTLNPYIVK